MYLISVRCPSFSVCTGSEQARCVSVSLCVLCLSLGVSISVGFFLQSLGVSIYLGVFFSVIGCQYMSFCSHLVRAKLFFAVWMSVYICVLSHVCASCRSTGLRAPTN